MGLTGCDEQTLLQQIERINDFGIFLHQAAYINPNASKITGVICSFPVEEIEDCLLQRFLL
ncbi:MAG: DUF2200 family protein [Bacteroidota bacterium]